jgi:ubiquinone/menaquinone biosynthesis C-methylase UbiE
MTTAEPRYTLASSDEERARLARQAEVARPVTERLFRRAGIGPGYRVLDVGSGAGDVAMLAGELVGNSGTVLGIDRDEAQLQTAAARCSASGLNNVRFEVADLNDPPTGPFDAVVGRLVLMYQSDPGRAIATLAERLAPRGVLAFVEVAMPLDEGQSSAMCWPRHELAPNVFAWIESAFAATQVVPLLGLRLPSMYRAAGLDPQDVEAVCFAYRGEAAAVMNASLIRSMLPVIVEHGIATSDDIDIDTLADRIYAAAGDDLVYLLPPAVASWARKG